LIRIFIPIPPASTAEDYAIIGSSPQAFSTPRDGQVLGHVLEEPNCTVVDGVLISLGGQDRREIGYREA
jgi:hypothetical protein